MSPAAAAAAAQELHKPLAYVLLKPEDHYRAHMAALSGTLM